MNLEEFFKRNPKVAIAFSGGCDSAFLAYSAKLYAESVKLYYAKTAFQPEFEYRDVLRFSNEYDIDLCVLRKDILVIDEITGNGKDRCYYCKNTIFNMIISSAKEDGYKMILDGTNASDDVSDRPGMRALEEMKVVSPLRLCNLTKSEIRTMSKEAGLFTWNKPAYACLATRIPTDKIITKEDLIKTEKAESYLAGLGFSDFRVRIRDFGALVQITENQKELYEEKRDIIETNLKDLYDEVRLDEVFRKA